MDTVADVIAGVALLASMGQFIYTQAKTRPQLKLARNQIDDLVRKQEREDRAQADQVVVEQLEFVSDRVGAGPVYAVAVTNGSDQRIHNLRAGIRFGPNGPYQYSTVFNLERRGEEPMALSENDVQEGRQVDLVPPGHAYNLIFRIDVNAAPGSEIAARFEDHVGNQWQAGMNGRMAKLRPGEWET